MTKQELQNSAYFNSLAAWEQESIMQSGMKFETENDIREFVSKMKRK